MSIWKRAFLYVTRKKGKNMVLFAILMTMATLVLTGLSIRRASGAEQLELRQRLGGRFTICVDWENSPYVVRETVEDNVYDEETGKTSYSYLMYSTKQLTAEELEAVREIPGVKYCSARQDSLIPFEELSLFPGTVPVDIKMKNRTKTFGVCQTEDDELFRSGELSLTEGRHITADDIHAAVISEDLTEESGLKVGDFITTHGYDAEEETFTGNRIRVQIVGLFRQEAAEPFGENVTTYDRIQNRVFVDLKTVVESEGNSAVNYGFSAVEVIIEDPKEMEQVISDVKALPCIDRDAFVIDVENETYENAAAPLEALDDLVVIMLIVIIAVSAVILALILSLWTRNRIHETGIFLSVGIRKSNIIGQYLLEVLLIAVPAFGISFFTGNAAAGEIGGRLLEQTMGNGIRIQAGPEDIARLYLIGTAVIAAAVSVSSVTVMRLKPRGILSKMS